jgi:GT2 family glycosyltransferase
MTEQMLDLTIIIPNYNTERLLRNCLASIYEHTKGITFEIICIDDNSPDGSADMVAGEFPNVILIRNTVNQNYVRNNNLGMKMSRARYACWLNSDTVLISNAFEALVGFMDSRPNVAACGPKLLNPDGTLQPCIRSFPRPGTLLLQAVNWHILVPASRSMKRLYGLDLDHTKSQRVENIGTTAFVVRRSTWEQAGMLDERFQIYLVDWVYNFMLQKKGYEVWYTPCAEIVHFGSQSVGQNVVHSIRELHDAMILFSDAYDYFGSNAVVKLVVRLAVRTRCILKLAEHHLGSNKQLNKGPLAPSRHTVSQKTDGL